jgi:uncharacterized protein YbaR (Trm112 family)
MHSFLTEIVCCPACHGDLTWDIALRSATRLVNAVAHCTVCAAEYFVRDEIGVFLTPDLPREDLWQEVGNRMSRVLAGSPDLDRQLMGVPLEALNPADQILRGFVLEERGDFETARTVHAIAEKGLYTAAYLACRDRQFAYLVKLLNADRSDNETVFDLASGRGYLIDALLAGTQRTIVASDFSPRILKRDQAYWRFFGVYDRISLLAFDARRTPYRDGALRTLTTYVGLPNIEHPQRLLAELRRVVRGRLLAISPFYPPDDQVNLAQLTDAGQRCLQLRESALEAFTEAGWSARLENSCVALAEPTPVSQIFEGLRIDGMPVASTRLEHTVIHAQ